MQFGLKTFFAIAISLSILFVSPAFFGQVLKNVPPFFLPILFLFVWLFRNPQKASFSCPKKKETFFLAVFLWSVFVFFSSSEADRISSGTRVRKTLLQIQSAPSIESKDAWGHPLIVGAKGFYSFGADQQDDQGYYDDIGPALSWLDALKKSIRTLWIFHRSLFLFFSFGMIYGTLFGGLFLFRKLPNILPPPDFLKTQSPS
ncbi:MAG: hypothetical protein AABZ60_18960 [Planctomycetota bacterium]